MKLSAKELLIQLVLIVGFLSLPFLFNIGEKFHSLDFRHNRHDQFTLGIYSLLLVLFYVNYHYFLPSFYFKNQYIEYVSSIILCLAIVLALYFIFDFKPFHLHHHMPPFGEKFPAQYPRLDNPSEFKHHQPPPIATISQLIFVYLIGLFVNFFIRNKQYLKQLEAEKKGAEIATLKSKINPHFLFNSFNTIYALAVKEGANKTADGMLKLSGMMRYVVTETSNEFVPLEKEMNYINDFIELQKLRLDKSIQLTYTNSIETNQYQIVPMLLIPFIENAFKHGVNPDEDSNISISLSMKQQNLLLQILNKKVSHQNYANEQSGMGLVNTKNRLELLYPSTHKLSIIETDLNYSVNLTITLV